MQTGTDSSFWIVNCFFNPGGYATPLKNFIAATGALLQQGLNVLTVELAFQDAPFMVPDDHEVVRLRTNHVLWHKERLLNIGMRRLPPSCTKVAWVDCDLFFEPGTFTRASELLDQVEVVQLFDRIVYLPRGHESYQGISLDQRPSFFAALKIFGGAYFIALADGTAEYGAPGGAYAARREVMAAELYDRYAVGANDAIWAFAVAGCLERMRFATPEVSRDARDWERRLNAARRTFTFDVLPGTVYHLWHGEVQDRRYNTRDQRLKAHGYDPAVDIRLGENGLYEWATSKHDLQHAVSEYFLGRFEDGTAEQLLLPLADPSSTNAVLISNLYHRINRLQAFRDSLEYSRAQALSNIDELRKEAVELRRWVASLEDAKSWLEQQCTIYRERAEQGLIYPKEERLVVISMATAEHREVLAWLAASGVALLPQTSEAPRREQANGCVALRPLQQQETRRLPELISAASLGVLIEADDLDEITIGGLVAALQSRAVRVLFLSSTRPNELHAVDTAGAGNIRYPISPDGALRKLERIRRELGQSHCLNIDVERIVADAGARRTTLRFLGIAVENAPDPVRPSTGSLLPPGAELPDGLGLLE